MLIVLTLVFSIAMVSSLAIINYELDPFAVITVGVVAELVLIGHETLTCRAILFFTGVIGNVYIIYHLFSLDYFVASLVQMGTCAIAAPIVFFTLLIVLAFKKKMLKYAFEDEQMPSSATRFYVVQKNHVTAVEDVYIKL